MNHELFLASNQKRESGDLRGSVVNVLDFNGKIDFGILIVLFVFAFCVCAVSESIFVLLFMLRLSFYTLPLSGSACGGA
jgi:hypothetical protein